MRFQESINDKVIKCNTQAEAEQLLKHLYQLGYVWAGGKPICKDGYVRTLYDEKSQCCYHPYTEAGCLRVAVDSEEYYREDRLMQITEFQDMVIDPPICRILGVAVEEEWYVEAPGVPRDCKYRINADGQRQYYWEGTGWCNSADEEALSYILNHPECIRHHPPASLDNTAELRRLLNLYPDSPLLVLSKDMSEPKDKTLSSLNIGRVYADNLTLYYGHWLNKKSYEETYRADAECIRHPEMSDEEFDKIIRQKMSGATFHQYIIIETK